MFVNKGAGAHEIRNKETTLAEGQTHGHQSFTEKLEILTSLHYNVDGYWRENKLCLRKQSWIISEFWKIVACLIQCVFITPYVNKETSLYIDLMFILFICGPSIAYGSLYSMHFIFTTNKIQRLIVVFSIF